MTKNSLPTAPGPIGVFDSGYGGLTILKEMRRRLPHYDYLYLGDNARAPYGARSLTLSISSLLRLSGRCSSADATSSSLPATRRRPRRCVRFSSATSRISTRSGACSE